MTIEDQLDIITSLVDKVSVVSGVGVEEILTSNKKNGKIVSTRAYISREAVARGVSHRLLAKHFNKDRVTILHYLRRYKKNFDYEMIEMMVNKINNENNEKI